MFFFDNKVKMLQNMEAKVKKAIEEDDVALFNQLSYEKKYTNETLERIYKFQAFYILMANREKFNLLGNDQYGYPLWWKVFQSDRVKNSENFIQLLKGLNVNFNKHDNCGYSYSTSLAWNLLHYCNFYNLSLLLDAGVIDVNCIHRTDCQETLLHTLSRVAYHRRQAGVNCIEKIVRCGDIHLKDIQGYSYLDKVVNRSNSLWQLEVVKKFHEINLTLEQQAVYYVNKQMSKFCAHREIESKENTELFPYIFVKVIFNDKGIIQTDDEGLTKSNFFERACVYLSLEELSKMEQIKLPSGSYIYRS